MGHAPRSNYSRRRLTADTRTSHCDPPPRCRPRHSWRAHSGTRGALDRRASRVRCMGSHSAGRRGRQGRVLPCPAVAQESAPYSASCGPASRPPAAACDWQLQSEPTRAARHAAQCREHTTCRCACGLWRPQCRLAAVSVASCCSQSSLMRAGGSYGTRRSLASCTVCSGIGRIFCWIMSGAASPLTLVMSCVTGDSGADGGWQSPSPAAGGVTTASSHSAERMPAARTMRGGGTSSGQLQRYDTRVRRRTCEFSRGTVGSAGTCQPAAAARRSRARRRARPAYDAGVHLRPRLGPANRPSAARIRGRRTMAEEVGVVGAWPRRFLPFSHSPYK
eukprot:scaffold43380_cov66-Phaeocystis_antarctica.AAC.4